VLAWLLALALATAVGSEPAVLESAYSPRDPGRGTDPDGDTWVAAPRVLASRNRMGEPVAGPPTEIRSRWTDEHLFLLFICPYADLHLKPDPTRDEETARLWLWDVAEAFIGANPGHITRYKEFQASPQGEWADLDIDRGDPEGQAGLRWNSGFTVEARIDAAGKTWYVLMRIPFAALDTPAPRPGLELRLGLFRIAGAEEPRTRYVWQPTGRPTFHVPEAFGILRLR
jgi:hypothetical protein